MITNLASESDVPDAARLDTILKVAKYLAVSALAVTVWDCIVSFTKEYRRIWKGKWTIAKVLYLFNRYWSIGAPAVTLWLVNASMTAEECSHLFRLQVALPMWTLLASEAILAFRTYVFLGRDIRLLALLLVLLVGECAFMLVVVFTGLHQVPLAGGVGSCAASGSKVRSTNLNTGVFIAPVIFDFFVTVLTLVKAYRLRRDGNRSNSLQLFVRGGLVYFVVLTTLNIVNLAFFTQPYQAIQPIIAQPTIQLSSILTCRLVLSLLDPKNAPQQSQIESSVGTSSSFFQTGFETKHDFPAPTANEPILPTTVAYSSGTEKGSGMQSGLPEGHLDIDFEKGLGKDNRSSES